MYLKPPGKAEGKEATTKMRSECTNPKVRDLFRSEMKTPHFDKWSLEQAKKTRIARGTKNECELNGHYKFEWPWECKHSHKLWVNQTFFIPLLALGAGGPESGTQLLLSTNTKSLVPTMILGGSNRMKGRKLNGLDKRELARECDTDEGTRRESRAIEERGLAIRK
ncbi:hypothetical protein B0H14DRAFT_2598791 [Mycena olivaceomarginata]|nr:hypothetical protein B0H14DRAFT_2598791 [Mycena olivaceomarginata]